MSSIPSSDVRLPSYEGHLILNQATLSDISQTSACTTWSEQWCSLEDGRLLVYPDHTAAVVTPDETSAIIDIRNFASVQVSAVSSEEAFELTLSTAPPPSSSSSRLLLTKSVASLHRLLPDQALHRHASEDKHHPPTAYNARTSTPPLALSPPPKLSAHAGNHSRSLARKPWSKLASGSERLNGPASTSSNGSLRTMATMHIRDGSTSSSAYSSTNSRASTDFASGGAPSPRTPISPAFSDSTECISIRVASAEALAQWVEAISLTIKLHRETTAPSNVVKQQRTALTRPSLSSLSGFRTPTNLQPSPTFPAQGALVECHDDEPTPKASRDRRASATCFAFAPPASRALQDNSANWTVNSISGSKQQDSFGAVTSAVDGENVTINASQRGRPTEVETPTSVTFVVDRKASKRERTHKRSLFLASSSFSLSSGRRMSGERRNSPTGRQPLPPGSSMISPAQRDAASLANSPSQCAVAHRIAAAPATRTEPVAVRAEDRPRSPSHASSPVTRHRRSGSLLHFGSSRVMAWRDNFTAGNARAPPDAPLGLGLLLDNGETSERRQTSLSSSVHSLSKGTSRLPKIRSFRFLPTIKMTNNDGDVIPSAQCDDSLSPRPSRTPQCASDAHSPSAAPPQSQGMSRTTSLLSLTKNALNSLRGRSSRQHVSSIFAHTDTTDTPKLSTESMARIDPTGFDFSYELVQPTRQTSSSGASIRDSVSVGARTSSTFTPRIDPAALAAADHSISRSCTDDMDDTSSPSLPVERILPPEQIISTFDQLRAADPMGRSCDWLGQIETATRRGSIDWSATRPRPSRPSLRTTASQSFVSRDEVLGLTTGQRLRSSTSAWDLPAAPPPERQTRRFDGVDQSIALAARMNAPPKQLNASHASNREDPPLTPRSLPAPPRAYKRRARISTFTPPQSALLPPAEDGASPTRRASPFADMTNSPSRTRDDSLPKTMHKLGLGSPSRSPKSLGGATRRRSAVAGRPAKTSTTTARIDRRDAF